MALNFRKFIEGLRIVPKAASTASEKGDLDVVSGSGKLNYHNGTTASPIVTEAHSATLTNKTIDGDDNTIQDVGIASLKTVLGDADKVIRRDAAGAVTSGNSLPNSSQIVTLDSSDTLTNKTLTTPVVNTSITGGAGAGLTIQSASNQNLSLQAQGTGVVQLESVSVNANTITGGAATFNIKSDSNQTIELFSQGTGAVNITSSNVMNLVASSDVVLYSDIGNIDLTTDASNIYLTAASGGGLINVTGRATVNNSLNFAKGTPTNTAGALTSPSTPYVLVSANINTIGSGNDGQVIVLTNTSASAITIANEFSATGNGIRTGSGDSISLLPKASLILIYNSTAPGYWYVVGGVGGSSAVLSGGSTLTGTYNSSVLVLGDCTLSGASVTINGDFTVLGDVFTSGSPAVTIRGDVRVSNGFDYSTTTQQTLTIDGDYYLGQFNNTSRTTTTTVGSSTAGVGSSNLGSIFPSPSMGDLTLIISNVFDPYILKNINLTNYNYYLTVTFTSGALSGQSFSNNIEIMGSNEIYVGDSGIPPFAVGDSFTLTYSLSESYTFRGRSTQAGNNLTVNGSIYGTNYAYSNFISLGADTTTSSLSKANGGNLTVGGDIINNKNNFSILNIYNSGSSVNGGNGGIVTIFGNVTGYCNFVNVGGQGTTSLSPGNGGKIIINGNFIGGNNTTTVSDALFGAIDTRGGPSSSSLNATVAKGGSGGNVYISGYCIIDNITAVGASSTTLAGVTGGNAGTITFKGYAVLNNLTGFGGSAAAGTNKGAASTIYFGAGCGIRTLSTYTSSTGNPASGASSIIFNGNCSINVLQTEVGQSKVTKNTGISGLYIPVVLRVNLFQNDGILSGTVSTASQIGISADRLYTYNNTLGRWQHTTFTNT